MAKIGEILRDLERTLEISRDFISASVTFVVMHVHLPSQKSRLFRGNLAPIEHADLKPGPLCQMVKTYIFCSYGSVTSCTGIILEDWSIYEGNPSKTERDMRNSVAGIKKWPKWDAPLVLTLAVS